MGAEAGQVVDDVLALKNSMGKTGLTACLGHSVYLLGSGLIFLPKDKFIKISYHNQIICQVFFKDLILL